MIKLLKRKMILKIRNMDLLKKTRKIRKVQKRGKTLKRRKRKTKSKNLMQRIPKRRKRSPRILKARRKVQVKVRARILKTRRKDQVKRRRMFLLIKMWNTMIRHNTRVCIQHMAWSRIHNILIVLFRLQKMKRTVIKIILNLKALSRLLVFIPLFLEMSRKGLRIIQGLQVNFDPIS